MCREYSSGRIANTGKGQDLPRCFPLGLICGLGRSVRICFKIRQRYEADRAILATDSELGASSKYGETSSFGRQIHTRGLSCVGEVYTNDGIIIGCCEKILSVERILKRSDRGIMQFEYDRVPGLGKIQKSNMAFAISGSSLGSAGVGCKNGGSLLQRDFQSCWSYKATLP